MTFLFASQDSNIFLCKLMATVSSHYAISAYRRFLRNALPSGTWGNLSVLLGTTEGGLGGPHLGGQD